LFCGKWARRFIDAVCTIHRVVTSTRWWIIAGADIAAIIVKAGMGTSETVRKWLMADFPTQARWL
jgi:hypothetical protein